MTLRVPGEPGNPERPAYLRAVFLGSMAFVFLNFGLPVRADDLGISAVAIGGMYSVFTATMLLVRPLVGYCLDRFGRRWFFTSAFFFYALAMFSFSRSTELGDFYLARFLQGIGASLMWVSARTMVADLSDTKSRGQAMGTLATSSVRGSMIGGFWGFFLLGLMPMPQAWLWSFSGYAVAALVALVWSLWRVGETRALTTAAGAVDRAHPEMIPSSSPRSRDAASVVAGKWPADLRRVFLIVFFSAFASALIEPIYLIFLKSKFDLGVISLALLFLPSGLVYAILPRYSGRWADRIGRAPVIAAGTALAGLLSIALPWWPHVGFIAASYFLFAVGWAMASPAEDALVADLAPDGKLGTVMGAREAAAGVGAAVGPLVGGFVFDHWSQELTFVINGSLLLFTAFLTLAWFPRRLTGP